MSKLGDSCVCQPGEFVNTSLQCQRCPADTYSATEDASSCSRCSDGYTPQPDLCDKPCNDSLMGNPKNNPMRSKLPQSSCVCESGKYIDKNDMDKCK
jgi:hypothetical protein